MIYTKTTFHSGIHNKLEVSDAEKARGFGGDRYRALRASVQPMRVLHCKDMHGLLHRVTEKPVGMPSSLRKTVSREPGAHRLYERKGCGAVRGLCIV